MNIRKIRIGQGFDVHKFGADRELKLGGVVIPFHTGLIAHSDGDVVLHAITDALLGAVNLGDIGMLFPDNDVKFLNIDSRILLREAYQKIREQNFILGNLDITILAQMPKIQPFNLQMRKAIADDLNCTIEQISIKATTTESLGFVGRKEGIACLACALLFGE